MKKVIYIKQSDKQKDLVINTVKRELKRVADMNYVVLSDKEIEELVVKVFAQLSRHISKRAKLKTVWSLTENNSIPLLSEAPDGAHATLFDDTQKEKEVLYIFSGKDGTVRQVQYGGMTFLELSSKIHEQVLNDAKVGAFYSALSYIQVTKEKGIAI